MNDEITQEKLEALKWKKIHWNPNSPEGGFFEFWRKISKAKQAEMKLSVRFDDDPRYGRRYMVYLVSGRFGSTYIALWNIVTMEQLLALYKLLKGAKP